jgi:hypothetical protein
VPAVLVVLEVAEVGFEGVEAVVPDFAVVFDPIGDFVEFFDPRFAAAFAALFRDDDESALGEDFNVFRNSRAADLEALGDPIDGELLGGEEAEDGTTIGVRYCLKYISSHYLRPPAGRRFVEKIPIRLRRTKFQSACGGPK